MPEYLFVYGTLLPGRAPRHLLGVVQELRSVGPASVPGLLYDLGEYPGAVVDQKCESSIMGHVFELPAHESLLTTLDRYEGFDPADRAGSLFVRERYEVVTSDGQSPSCWIYIYNRDPDNTQVVPHGDYARHRPIH
jgi:gamma-glutamylcyclotransferase (GGCT)/AIG2-like uncharacterized protein YtfP